MMNEDKRSEDTEMGVQVGKDVSDLKKTENIPNSFQQDTVHQMLLSYTGHLEDYERANGTFTLMSCTLLMTIIAATFTVNNCIVSMITTAAIPCLELIFIFCFSHYNRRIAYYRGYCINLEEKLNKNIKNRSLLYHKIVSRHAMEPYGKSTNFIMIIMVLIFLGSFGIYIYNCLIVFNQLYNLVIFIIAGVFFFLFVGGNIIKMTRILGRNGSIVEMMSDDNAINEQLKKYENDKSSSQLIKIKESKSNTLDEVYAEQDREISNSLEGRRSTRIGIVIAVTAVVATVCGLLYKLCLKMISDVPVEYNKFYFVNGFIFLAGLAYTLVIIFDISKYIYYDLWRCDVNDEDYKKYDDISDNAFSSLKYDFLNFLVLICFSFISLCVYISDNNILKIFFISISIGVIIKHICSLIKLCNNSKLGKSNKQSIPKTNTESSSESSTKSIPKTSTESIPETRTESSPETNTEGGSKTSTEGGSKTSTEGGSKTSTEGGSETSTEGGSETSTEGGSETSTEGGSETSTEGGSETSTEGGSETSTGGDCKKQVKSSSFRQFISSTFRQLKTSTFISAI